MDQDYATVSGTKVHRSDFAYAPPGSGPSEWKLPIHDANHVRNALARYSQTDLPADAKAGVWRKIKAAAKRFGVHVSDESSERPSYAEASEGKGRPAVRSLGEGRIAVLLAGLGKSVEVAGKATHEIPICVTGTWVKNSHKFSITADDLADMVRNFEKRKNDQVVIDYEHASEQPEVARGGAIPAAGWIHALTLTPALSQGERGNRAAVGEGATLLAQVEWTPEAARMIQSGQYRFFSPAIDWSFPDKETGESQGATLTSGALTNHPFLEELPPITLTESGVVLADVSTGYLDAPLTNVGVGLALPKNTKGTASRTPTGGKMASKKLSIKKIKGDDFDGDDFKGAQGHHGIFDGDDFVGHVHADDMKDHVKSCMDDGYGDLDDLSAKKMDDLDGDADDMDQDGKPKGQAGVKGHQKVDGEDMSELLRESGFKGSADRDVRSAVLSGLKLAATHELVEQREASRNLILTECLAPCHPERSEGSAVKGSFDTEKAKQLLRDKKIGAEDLLDAIEAKGMIDAAVAKGKVLPKDRAFFFEIAFNNPKKFTDYIAGAVPVVAFGSVGLGSTEQMPVDQEVDIETKKLMSERKVSYGKAMKEVFKSNPELENRYRAAHRAQPKEDREIVQ